VRVGQPRSGGGLRQYLRKGSGASYLGDKKTEKLIQSLMNLTDRGSEELKATDEYINIFKEKSK
jgi:hypothetical protein